MWLQCFILFRGLRYRGLKPTSLDADKRKTDEKNSNRNKKKRNQRSFQDNIHRCLSQKDSWRQPRTTPSHNKDTKLLEEEVTKLELLGQSSSSLCWQTKNRSLLFWGSSAASMQVQCNKYEDHQGIWRNVLSSVRKLGLSWRSWVQQHNEPKDAKNQLLPKVLYTKGL